ncbi:hypothetical protein Airi02_043710 [Actinoallomurus iriomotensis]|uniref:Uncharacterized protein n=1 Tax=Actinoallomurus iriomotensis TaxID=478107 RepID=A0A9W6S663_9ACTN|nr:hypothetical protein Airi02_043710 [Actinoallomurus iriomotensis]
MDGGRRDRGGTAEPGRAERPARRGEHRRGEQGAGCHLHGGTSPKVWDSRAAFEGDGRVDARKASRYVL